MDAEYIPAHVVNAVAAPREVMTAVGTATKQQTKDTLNTFLSSGDLSPQNPIRLTTVEELHDIIKNGTLRPGKDFEGRSGISAQLVDGKKPQKLTGVTQEQMSRMEREMANLQGQYKLVEQTYAEDVLNLVLARGYLAKLLDNKSVVRYIKQRRPEVLEQFEVIVETTSLDQ